jgi:3-hydroxyisobutyrate dehydrogenase-like beta-hydroxyacid dehydrogenase
MSTISPELTRRLAKAALAKGLGFLDTPMSGTSAMVERGDCAIFVGGDQAQADACRPIFDAIAKKTHYVGDVGMASLAKLATNLLEGRVLNVEKDKRERTKRRIDNLEKLTQRYQMLKQMNTEF